jgi:hypothetical protein
MARIYPRPARRWFGMISLSLLGVILIWIGAMHPPELFVWQAFLLLLGAVILWGAVNAYVATSAGLELTRDELRESGGRVLARMEDVRSVTSGALAFKPSNGFMVRLKRSDRMAWAPGLWWRLGRFVGVGGMTSGAEAKYMAEVMQVILTERDGKSL